MVSLTFSFFVYALLYTSRVLAIPTLQVRDVSQDVLSKLELFEQYSAAGYCEDNNDSPDTQLSCEAGNCPQVESADTDTQTEFENSLITDVTGYVAVDHTNCLIVVAFRGSRSVRNFLADINFVQVPTDICATCTAHKGFWVSWLEARDGVLDAVEGAADENPSYKVVAVGHSLGGAIASFAAAQLRNDGYDTALYTYGSPRIGGSEIADFITNQPGGNYRVTHYNDPVPRLPPALVGYRHIGPEYYIKSKNGEEVTTNDVKVCRGSLNLGCNNGHVVVDVEAHLWYFNSISACSSDDLLEWKRDVQVF
ncbi:Alpha/Beta hydrolase protein [Lineolata rhizophorae]|uniref:Alpha/Beta hydrolase protein n=1 Tax=Lineolata rhizophorae TaxID=578093 RepID=A0A6A6P472_9PEZI|nr:Alpha/Beta hydrolase protein [Lineolata rhizophorae]